MFDMLMEEQKERYSRNLKLRNFSEEDQEKLLRSSVLLVGVGGLGSPISIYLTAMGVGQITIVENDKVEISNLQRQIVLDTGSIGREKGEVAKEHLQKLNPEVKVDLVKGAFSEANARELVASHDMTIDASDNFKTKLLVNDACILENRPFSIGSVLEYHGQTSTFLPNDGPCYRCLFRKPEDEVIPTTGEVGVLSTIPGAIGVIQATEAIKVLLGKGNILKGRLLLVDLLEVDFQIVDFDRNENCPACGKNREIHLPRE